MGKQGFIKFKLKLFNRRSTDDSSHYNTLYTGIFEQRPALA